MKTRHIRGTTDYLNSLNLPEGMVGIDEEKKALRFYDGETVGGYEMLGTQAVEILYGPGPQTLLAEDMTAGFFGEVTSSELVTYNQLSMDSGISAGSPQFNEESMWLKFALDNKILFVAKKNIRSNITWSNLNSSNVITGNRIIEINNSQYRLRLFSGVSNTPVDEATTDPVYTHGSEWNRLMYPVHQSIPNSQEGNNWAGYTNDDINTGTGNGRGSWCQENIPYTDGKKVIRGTSGIASYNRDLMWSNYSGYGWRPILELVV